MRKETPQSVGREAGAGSGLFAGIGLVSGLGAAAASSCCVLPLALTVAGLGTGWTAILGVLVPYRGILVWPALTLVALSWFLALRSYAGGARCRGDGACARPPRASFTFGVLAVSTLFVVVAMTWRWWEPAAIGFLWEIHTRS